MSKKSRLICRNSNESIIKFSKNVFPCDSKSLLRKVATFLTYMGIVRSERVDFADSLLFNLDMDIVRSERVDFADSLLFNLYGNCKV